MKKSMLATLAMAGFGLWGGQAQAQTMDGKTVFAKNCAACHMATGAGIPGAFPALKANKFVLGDQDAVITTVLKGRGGMPTFAESLDDTQLSLAISYIRTSWGNGAAPVGADQVAKVREQSKSATVIKKEQPTNIH